MGPGSLSGETPPPELTTEGLLGLATFLRQLHLDLPNALTTTIAASCLSDRVRLVGQLDEPIALGRGPYTILFGRLTQASKRMLEQGALKVKRDVPSVPASMEGGEMVKYSVEYCANGEVRVSLHLPLEVSAPELPLAVPLPTPTLPLVVDIVSVYVLSESDGKVTDHRVEDVKLNGQPSVKELIRMARGEGGSGGASGGSGVQGLLNLLLRLSS